VRASVKIRTYDDYEYVVRCHVVPELSRVKLDRGYADFGERPF